MPGVLDRKDDYPPYRTCRLTCHPLRFYYNPEIILLYWPTFVSMDYILVQIASPILTVDRDFTQRSHLFKFYNGVVICSILIGHNVVTIS